MYFVVLLLQVYFGGAFIGNHIHQALKPTIISALTQAPAAVVQDRCPTFQDDVDVITVRYQQLFTAYADCRAIFSGCSAISDTDLQTLEVNIKRFLHLCRTEIIARTSGNITPKLHLLEEHTIPMMERLRVGLGLLGEHGAESIHSAFNNYETLFKNMSCKLARLRTMADQHLLACVMELSNIRPQSQKRKAQE